MKAANNVNIERGGHKEEFQVSGLSVESSEGKYGAFTLFVQAGVPAVFPYCRVGLSPLPQDVSVINLPCFVSFCVVTFLVLVCKQLPLFHETRIIKTGVKR